MADLWRAARKQISGELFRSAGECVRLAQNLPSAKASPALPLVPCRVRAEGGRSQPSARGGEGGTAGHAEGDRRPGGRCAAGGRAGHGGKAGWAAGGSALGLTVRYRAQPSQHHPSGPPGPFFPRAERAAVAGEAAGLRSKAAKAQERAAALQAAAQKAGEEAELLLKQAELLRDSKAELANTLKQDRWVVGGRGGGDGRGAGRLGLHAELVCGCGSLFVTDEPKRASRREGHLQSGPKVPASPPARRQRYEAYIAQLSARLEQFRAHFAAQQAGGAAMEVA